MTDRRNYDDESTKYDIAPEKRDTRHEEATQLDMPDRHAPTSEPAPDDVPRPAATSKNTPAWKRAMAAGGVGVLIGGLGTVITGMKAGEEPADVTDSPEADPDGQPVTISDVTDGQIAVAESPAAEMTFAEAFNAARTETGPGGTFEWHGNIYSTYTADEWNSLSDEARAEYNNHFSMEQIDTTGSDTVHSTAIIEDIGLPDISYDPILDPEPWIDPDPEPIDPAPWIDEEPATIVGIESQSANTLIYYGDGDGAVLFDYDHDGLYDHAAVDLDGDGTITSDEIIEISTDQFPLYIEPAGSDINDPLTDSGDII